MVRRRWLYPKLSKGDLWKRRRILAYFLIVFFVVLPHLRFGGKPLVLLDIAARRFILFGHTFLPTDTLLLALLMLGVFVTIVLATTFFGRVWCGWACPQTVYMEFLFRPIDRWFEGTTGKGGKPKRKPTGLMAVAPFRNLPSAVDAAGPHLLGLLCGHRQVGAVGEKLRHWNTPPPSW